MGAATGMSKALSTRLQPQPPTQQSRVALWVQPDYGPEINVGDVPYYDGRSCPRAFWAEINELWYVATSQLRQRDHVDKNQRLRRMLLSNIHGEAARELAQARRDFYLQYTSGHPCPAAETPGDDGAQSHLLRGDHEAWREALAAEDITFSLTFLMHQYRLNPEDGARLLQLCTIRDEE